MKTKQIILSTVLRALLTGVLMGFPFIACHASPASSTITGAPQFAAPLLQTMKPTCKTISVDTTTIMPIGVTSCAAGYVATGVKINGLPALTDATTSNISVAQGNFTGFKGNKIKSVLLLPFNISYIQLRSIGTVTNASTSNAVFTKTSLFSSVNQAPIPSNINANNQVGGTLQYTSPYSSMPAATLNTVQLVCAKRDIEFTSTVSKCNNTITPPGP